VREEVFGGRIGCWAADGGPGPIPSCRQAGLSLRRYEARKGRVHRFTGSGCTKRKSFRSEKMKGMPSPEATAETLGQKIPDSIRKGAGCGGNLGKTKKGGKQSVVFNNGASSTYKTNIGINLGGVEWERDWVSSLVNQEWTRGGEVREQAIVLRKKKIGSALGNPGCEGGKVY